MTISVSLRRFTAGLLEFAASRANTGADWTAAMLSESEHIDDDLEAARWALGSVGAITMQWVESAKIYLAVVLVGAAVPIFFEWHTDEELLTLLALVGAAGTIGLMHPKRFFASGLAIGLALPLAHALVLLFANLRPHYEAVPLNAGSTASLALLIIPSLFAAWAGAALAKRVRTLH